MPDPEVTIGVDFGTTNSVAAVCLPDGVEVLTNDIDSRKTPSCVYFKDAEREVGEAALRMALSYPQNTIRNVKSVLGVTRDILGDRTPLGAVRIDSYGSSSDPISVKISKRKLLLSEEVAAMILLELKKSAEKQLSGKATKAVLAVPSYFGAAQRQAVIDAAYLAGLRVTTLVNETTAAALAYAHDREGRKTVVMVDVGGGGCSMSVVRVERNKVSVLGHSGPRLPGGEDFDSKMVAFLKQRVKERLGKEIVDPRDTEILRSHWSKAKEKLSRIPQVPIRVYLPGIEQEIDLNLKRTDFQEQCRELFKEVTDGLARTLPVVRADEVAEVLLVGGCTRIPHLRDLIGKELDKPLSKAINPDEAVAVGAALLAAGCVEVTQEVLSLNTEVTIDDKFRNLPRNIALPQRHESCGSNYIAVEQEIITGQMSPTLFFRRKGIKVAEITVSGLLRVYGMDSGMQFILSGCVSPNDLSRKLKIIENYKQTEVAEIKRIEAKNALEKLLRVERGRPASAGDCFYEEIMELRSECEKRLKWLAEHSGETAKRYSEVREELEKQIDALRVKQELEKERVEARDCLRQTLEAAIERDIPEDHVHERALKLKKLCADLLTKLHENKLTLTKEFKTELESVQAKLATLESERKRHALLQRNRLAKESFKQSVHQSVLAWKKFSDETDYAVYRPYDVRFCTLSSDALKWLKAQGDTIDEPVFSEQLKVFLQSLSALEHELMREKEERERERVEVRSRLRETLVVALGEDIPEDPYHGQSLRLKGFCADLLTKLEDNKLTSTEDLKTQLESVKAQQAALEEDRKRHALLQRNRKAKTSFEESVLEAALSWKRLRDETDPDLFRPYGSRLKTLTSEAMSWLGEQGDAVDECYFSQRLKSFQHQIMKLETELKNDIASAELRRKHSLREAEKKVNEALSIKVPSDDDHLRNLLETYQQHWKELGEWLHKKPDRSHVDYDKLKKKIDDDMDELRQKTAQREERVRLMKSIGDLLTTGLEEFKGNVSFGQLTSWCRKWLATDPTSTNKDLGQYRVRVEEVVECLRTAQRHRLNQEKETNAAQAATEQALEHIGKLLPDFGFTEPSVAQDHLPTAPNSYDPKNYTCAVEVEDMDVDEDPAGSRPGFLEVTSPKIGDALDSKDVLTLWENLHQQPPIMLNSDEHKVMLESLSEQLAVEALDEACVAGGMALLMDREVTSDHEWVSLSLRYVVDTGDAVERLILVQDARDYCGSAADFSSYLFRQFKDLCGKAKMNWRNSLQFLSAVDCGHFGPHFVKLVHDETVFVKDVGSISVPLDKRVANACYETPAVSDRLKDYVAIFFSIIDVLREHFAMSGQRFKLLRRACDYVDNRDPWLTYTSSIKFLLDKRAKLPALLQQSVGLDPKQKLIMASVLEKMNEHLFTTCLVTFDGVFSQLQGDSDVDANSLGGWKSILRRLEGNEHVVSSLKFQECLEERIKACGRVFYLPQVCEARSLIRLITNVVTKVVSQMLTSFRDCCLMLDCLECGSDRSRGVFNSSSHNFHEELLSLRKLFPQCSMDSPQVVLKKLPRSELLLTRPALYRAAKRVLTMPLIPPVGPRSAAQLRDGVRRTAAILPTMGTAVVPVAVWACRPSEDALARALIDVQKRCPQLASSRPGLMVTKL